MPSERPERRLAAIMAADVAGYSRMMGCDEEGTHATLKAARALLFDPSIGAHHGRIVKTTGDGALVEFASAVDAVKCAIEIQHGMAKRNTGIAQDRRIDFRIGINIGDIIFDDGDIFGDGVNIAARLEALAPSGGICISQKVFDEIAGKIADEFVEVGLRELKNIARPVQVYASASHGDLKSLLETHATRSIRPLELPSIAILPFANLGGSKDDEYLADGIVEDALSALSHVSSLLVISRNSSFTFKGKNTDVREVGRQLGVRYVVEGSFRRSADRLRVTANLLDAVSGAHIWGERYERRVQDIFDIQDELTQELVTALRIKLSDGEQASLWLRSTNNFEAWGFAMRGADHVWRGTAVDNKHARTFLEMAVERDPAYAKATALIALTHYFDIRFNYSPSKEQSMRQAVEFTAKALELDAQEPYSVLMRGLMKSLDERFGEAVEDMNIALAISPNDAFCWLALARTSVQAERAGEAERAIRHAMRLNPLYPVNYLAVLGDALVHQGRTQDALEVFRQIVSRQPNYISAHLQLAGLHSLARDMDSARAAIAEVLRIDPQYRLAAARSFYLSVDEQRKQAFLDALRAAGLPE